MPLPPRSISLCITELDVGGAEKALVQIALGLQQKGWAVHVISLRDQGPLAKPLLDADIPVTALHCGSFLDVRQYWRLKQHLQKHRSDVLLCFLHQANIYGRLAGRAAGIPVRVSGVRVADRRWSVQIPERLTRCCVHHYVAFSRHVADTHAVLCGIPSKKITAIPNGVQPNITMPARLGHDHLNRLLFVGRLTDQKDPLALLTAFQKLPYDLRNHSTLTFVGEGPLRHQMETQISSFQLSDRVKLLGHRDDVIQLMQQSTLLVLPSRWEGMPNAVLEAMASGLPVIATAVDGTQELIQQDKTGWLVPSHNPETLSDTIAQALRNRDLRDHVAINAREEVARNFTWDAIVAKYHDLLVSLVDRSPAGHIL